MPVIIVDDGFRGRGLGTHSSTNAGTCGWDVTAAETLFWEEVPVRLKIGGQDDRTRSLSIRIMMWDQTAKGVPKTLGIVLTSEENRFFLYTMEVSEEDFAALRQDQGILVDFASFPSEIIGLLQACISSCSVAGQKFQAVLDATNGDANFSIVETNKFKHLTHISLIFRIGTDTTVKQVLSSRLQEVTSEGRSLELEKASLLRQVADLERAVAELNEVQASTKQVHERAMNDVAVSYERQLTEERNKRVQDLAQANGKANADISELSQKAKEEREALQKRIAQLEEEGRNLRDQKYNLDTRLSQLSAEHGSTTGELAALREECKRLKEANLEASRSAHELERSLNEAHVDLASFKSQVMDKESLNESNSGRILELERTKGLLEVSLEEYREQLKASEQRFREQKAEAEKGIQIIERFKNEMTACKSRMKTFKTMLHNQENQKRSVEDEHQRLKAQHDGLKNDLQAKQHDIDALKGTVEDQKAKLAEAYQQIDSNRKFISYLNSQCNQAQLGGGAGYPLQSSSRHNLPLSSLPQTSAVSVPGRPRYGAATSSAASVPPSGYHSAGGYGSLSGAPDFQDLASSYGAAEPRSYKPPAPTSSGYYQELA